ncbi:MAG: BadF/BadG/BcrA/BcrD ATPase family protein [Opitutaceae bacterium]|nr:BadF/BadG/BcrA/BcrD ATPase family protein [Opitutaceae bacterium]
MDFFLGFDGGGSRTRAALCSRDGALQATAEAAGSNPHHAGWEGCARMLRSAFDQVITSVKAQGCGQVRICGAFFGLAGVSSPDERAQVAAIAHGWPELSNSSVGVDHDIRIAWAGALAGNPGVAIIAGTGSSAYGCNSAGESARCGGWGALLDDVGSGYWLAIEAIKAVTHGHDGRGEPTALREDVFGLLGVSQVESIPGAAHAPDMTRDRIATLAPAIFARAQGGDLIASQILERGARELARLAAALQARLFGGGAMEVALTGGLSGRKSYADLLRKALLEAAPSAQLVAPRHSSLAGAVILAALEAKHNLPPSVRFGF